MNTISWKIQHNRMAYVSLVSLLVLLLSLGLAVPEPVQAIGINFDEASRTDGTLVVSVGTVVGWGWNEFGQTTAPAGLSDVAAIAAGGQHSLALKSDGTVVGWGRNNYGQASPPAGLSDVVAIAGGGIHSLSLKSNGTIVGWGYNRSGQASPPAGLSDVVAIAAGAQHSLALKADGTVVTWGNNLYGATTVPAGLSDVVAISAGTSGYHGLALKADGTVGAWGWNLYGQASPPTGLANVIAIAAGDYHSLALKSDGTVVGWGLNSAGQASPPAGLSDVVAISAGRFHSLALKSDGTVVAWGANVYGETTVPAGLSNVVAIVASECASLALVVPNEPPVADPNGPYLGAMESAIAFDGAASSDPDGDALTYDWDWGDSSSSPDVGATPTHTYIAAGIYNVCLTVTDPAGKSDTGCTYAVVYDPEGGFVTGGGWINSPERAYTSDPTLTGKATFGFVSKYKKGATVPTGNTEFQFKVADLNFKSTTYDWLVIAGTKAMYKGTGTINGTGEYGFMLSAIDGTPDKFRIKIWDKATETVIYDDQLGATEDADPATELGGGSIVVHKK